MEHSISALSKAFCRDATVALRSSSVSRRLSMMTWLSRFSLSGAGMEVGEGRGPTTHQHEKLGLWVQHPTPESHEEQVLGQKVGGLASLSGMCQTREAKTESPLSGHETLFLLPRTI